MTERERPKKGFEYYDGDYDSGDSGEIVREYQNAVRIQEMARQGRLEGELGDEGLGGFF